LGISEELAAGIVAEIGRRNRQGWNEGSQRRPVLGEPELQPFVVDRLEVTYFVNSSRICTETVTQRWLSVDLNDAVGIEAVDRYKVRTKYVTEESARSSLTTKILPLMNCTAGEPEIDASGWITTAMHFPQAVGHGESVFFASRVKYSTETAMEPPVYIQVTSLGIVHLIMRVQFDPDASPSLCWAYGGSRDPSEGVVRGTYEGGRMLTPTRLGYVEYVTENCPPGWFYAIGWSWA
jgi:hypothetical protein